MATIKDIAERLNISVSTVSKGLNGATDISEELRQLVLDAAVEMGYTTKKMKKQQNRRLCLFIENMEYKRTEHFGYDIVLGFRQAAYQDNWDVTVQPVTPDFQEKEKYGSYLLKNGYSGAFLVGFSLKDMWMKQLRKTSMPTVLFDNYINKNLNVGYVGVDNHEGIDLAVEHLVKLGHKEIAFLNGSKNSMVSEQRHQAFLNAMASHGVKVNKKLLAYGYYVSESAKYHVPTFLSQGATAVVCGNDLIAYGVINECARNGYRVPEDISVIGFDDLPASAHQVPPLTTIRQNRIELGKSGFYTLRSLINKVYISKTLLRAQFINRKSTAPVRSASRKHLQLIQINSGGKNE